MRILTLVFFAFLSLVPTPVFAEDLAKIRLLPQHATIQPGDEIWIGIEESIAPHWHTYWANPGDSGLPLRITWDLPEGFEIGDIQWPVPHKIAYEPLMNYGYEEHVILLQKLKVPQTLPAGPLTLKAGIEVLVCREECIPEQGTYVLTLNAPDDTGEDNTAYLDAAAQKLPHEQGWEAGFSEENGDFVLRIPVGDKPELMGADPAQIEFFPLDWGALENAAPQKIQFEDLELVIRQKRGDRPLEQVENPGGVLAVEKDGQRMGFSLGAHPWTGRTTAPPPVTRAGEIQTQTHPVSPLSLAGALIFALLGGLVLNLMPCVFPVLSLKALSLVKIAQKHPERARLHGLAYTAGVMASFLAIAALLMGLKSAGAQIGWGFQLQNPFIVGSLSYLLFIIGLNLSGFFDLANPFGNLGGRLTQKEGPAGSFFTGILATLVATPCTAPFMAGALGFALLQPAIIGLLVFAALGLGLALPYLMLAFVPALRAWLPRPGPWMEIFRQALAFPMFGAALWLLWVLGLQTGLEGALALLIGMLLIAFSLWLLRHKPQDRFWRGMVTAIAAISLFLAFLSMPKVTLPITPMAHPPATFGEPFSQDTLDLLIEGDDPVFVEMTAAWCITCKINHAVAINTQSTKTLFQARKVRYLIGDWTHEDEVVTKYLESYGRSGVPLYVYYGPRDGKTGQRPEAVILPQVLTPGIVRDTIR